MQTLSTPIHSVAKVSVTQGYGGLGNRVLSNKLHTHNLEGATNNDSGRTGVSVTLGYGGLGNESWVGRS